MQVTHEKMIDSFLRKPKYPLWYAQDCKGQNEAPRWERRLTKLIHKVYISTSVKLGAVSCTQNKNV